MLAILKFLGKALLFLVVAFGLSTTIVPRFLDRIYYRGPESGHFDSQRFFNPDGDEDTARPPGGGGRGGFFLRYLTGRDGRPPWPDHVPVRAATHAELAAPLSNGSMRATWVGHATVLVQVAGLNILTDPIWSERAGPFGFGPKRVAKPGVAFDDLPRIDLVLISHNHYDHMDLATLKRLWDRDRPAFVTSLGNDAILRSVGISALGLHSDAGVQALDWGETATVGDRRLKIWSEQGARGPAPIVRVSVVRNHHWGSRWFADRNRALWSAFLISTPAGDIFFAGDTGLGDGRWPAAARKAAIQPIRLALIPIGAFRFAPGQMFSGSHIGPIYAAEIHDRLGASTSLPIHWGTFRLSYEQYRTPPRLLAATVACTGQTGFEAVRIGRPVDVPPIGARPPRPASPRMTPDQLERCLNTPAVRAMR